MIVVADIRSSRVLYLVYADDVLMGSAASRGYRGRSRRLLEVLGREAKLQGGSRGLSIQGSSVVVEF